MFSNALELYNSNLPIIVCLLKKQDENQLLQTRQYSEARPCGLAFIEIESLGIAKTTAKWKNTRRCWVN
jgi:hypothetical protein